MDASGQFLNCIRLGLDRTRGIMGEISARKEFRLIPCDSVRGRCYIGRAESQVDLLSSLNVR